MVNRENEYPGQDLRGGYQQPGNLRVTLTELQQKMTNLCNTSDPSIRYAPLMDSKPKQNLRLAPTAITKGYDLPVFEVDRYHDRTGEFKLNRVVTKEERSLKVLSDNSGSSNQPMNML